MKETSRQGRRPKRALLIAVVAIALALWGQGLAQQSDLSDVLILFGTAALLFACATSVARDGTDIDVRPCAPAKAARVPKRTAVALLVSGLLLCAYAAFLFRRDLNDALPWLIYLPGVALSLWGILTVVGRGGGVAAARPKARGRELLLVVLIVLVAAFFRFYRLDAQPAGFFSDEAMYGLDAMRVVHGEAFPAYFEANFGRGALFVYLVSGSLKLLGSGTFAVRLVASFIGILTIPALYAFVRALCGPRAALVAALLLAVARWHVNFSRIGFDAILLPLIELIVFYWATRALQRNEMASLVWAGVAIGLGLNSYVGFRLVPPIIVVYFAYWLFAKGRAAQRRHLMITAPAGPTARFLNGLKAEDSPAPETSAGEPLAVSARIGARDAGTQAAMLVGVAALVAMPFLVFYVQHPSVVNQRLETASVFAGKTFETGQQALVSNVGKHLAMFNLRGDPNGRHNLPGEPMLDFFTGALFVLGVASALARVRRPEYALFVVWLLAMLSAGILSVDFEAPQALRTIGAVPVAIIFAALALDRLLRLGDLVGGMGRPATAIVVVGMLVSASYLNFGNYFERQATNFAAWNDFSTGEALLAKEMQALGSGWEFFVTSLYFEHPTVRFLAPDARGYHRIGPVDSLPIQDQNDRSVALFLDAQQTSIFAQAKRYYPNAVFKQYSPPFGGPPTLLEVQLRPADLQSAHGLVGQYHTGKDWSAPPQLERSDAAIDFDWHAASPLPAPFGVEWRGTLSVAAFGTYVLGVHSPGPVELWLDDASLLQGDAKEQRLVLAKGNHALLVRALVLEGDGRTELYWQPPGSPPGLVPSSVLFSPSIGNNGLLGSYYGNASWNGEPALQEIDPSLALYFHITPLPRPYSVEWRGKVETPLAGEYAFGLESIDDSWLEVDGQSIVAAHVPNRYEEGRTRLAAGWHDVRVRYLDQSGWSHINLYWTPPGGRREIVPVERLRPQVGNIRTGQPVAPTGSASAPSDVTTPPPLTGSVKPALRFGSADGEPARLRAPRDLALAVDGAVYVADTDNGRVARFDNNGHFSGNIGGNGPGAGQIERPIALALTPDGDLIVLEEPSGWVSRFSGAGEFRQRFGGPAAGFYHPRGLAVGRDGTIYVADTGFARIVAFSKEGQKLREIGGKGAGPGQLLGPVGLGIDRDGKLWVADVENNRVQQLGPNGDYLGSFAIPSGGTVDGAHIALGATALYLSDPARDRILVYGFDGALLGQWGSRGDGDGQLRRPVGLAVDAAGAVWVAERDGDRVERFVPE